MYPSNVALAIQCAHYWAVKKPLDYHAACKEANALFAGGPLPKYLDQWIDTKGKEYDSHPVITFLRNLRCDRERGR